MDKRYIYSNIRTLLISGFSDDQLRDLCKEEPELEVVHQNRPQGTNRETFVRELVEEAERRLILDRLLELARDRNPRQYQAHRPYYQGEPVESTPQPPALVPDKAAPIPSEPIRSGPARPLELFFSYSHKDEALRDELATHLKLLQRQGIITAWHDRQITAGSEWAGAIDDHLNSARIILLLISADFIASDYCYDIELKRAMERHAAGEAVVIPIILRPADWSGAPFGKLQALPKNAQPVTTWSNRDEAWLNVTQGIRRVAAELAAKPYR
jgi:hypothetical protein